MADRQVAQTHAAYANAFQSGYLETDQLAHPSDLTLLALAQNETQLVSILPRDLRALERNAVELEPVVEKLKAFGGELALDAHEIFFFDLAPFADELSRDTPVLREHEQSSGIDVESACRRQSSQVGWVKPALARVGGVVIVGRDERYSGAMTRLRLGRDIPDRFV